MPFKSLAQSRAAFGGYLGRAMQAKAREFASQTEYATLPKRVGASQPSMRDAIIRALKK